MTINFPGPYQLRIHYEMSVIDMGIEEHVMNVNVHTTTVPDPGTPFEDIILQGIPTGTLALDTFTDGLTALMIPMMANVGCEVTYVELWKYDAGTDDALWVSTYSANVAGTGAQTCKAATQTTYVFRTYEGGVCKIVMMEDTWQWGVSSDYNALSVAQAAFVDYLLLISGNCFILGKDTSRPIVFLKAHPCQNDALFNKRFR